MVESCTLVAESSLALPLHNPTHSHTTTHSHTHTPTHIPTHAHILTYPHTTHSPTRPHTHTSHTQHTFPHAHTLTHPHTPTRLPPVSERGSLEEKLSNLEDESAAVKVSLIQLLQEKSATNKTLALENSRLNQKVSTCAYTCTSVYTMHVCSNCGSTCVLYLF